MNTYFPSHWTAAGLLAVGSYSFVVWNTFPTTEWRLEGLVKFMVSEEDVCGGRGSLGFDTVAEQGSA